MRKPAIVAYLLAALIIAADQASKYWIVQIMGLREPGHHIEVSNIFDLTMVWNRGVSFGLFRSPDGQETIRWLLALFAAVISVFLIVWIRKAKRLWTGIAVGLIIGGALGNLVDRVLLGHVIDFLNFENIGFKWVFNVADAGINVGMAILLIETFLTGDKDKAPAAPADEAV